MCLHTLLVSYSHCPHYDPIPHGGPGFVIAMKCELVLEEFRYYHSQAERLPEIYPPPCPKACPPIWGTVECRGNVIIANHRGKCGSCSRLDWLTEQAVDLRNFLCQVERATEQMHQILGEFVGYDESSADDLFWEMKHFIHRHRALFSNTSLRSIWRAILDGGLASSKISVGAVWFFIAFLQLYKTWLMPRELESLEGFLQRSQPFPSFPPASLHNFKFPTQRRLRARSLGEIPSISIDDEEKVVSRTDIPHRYFSKKSPIQCMDIGIMKDMLTTRNAADARLYQPAGHHARSVSAPNLSRTFLEPGIFRHDSDPDRNKNSEPAATAALEPHSYKSNQNKFTLAPESRSRKAKKPASSKKKPRGGNSKRKRLKPLGRIPQPQYRSDILQLDPSITYPWQVCAGNNDHYHHHIGRVRPGFVMPQPPFKLDMEAAMWHAERIMPQMQQWLRDGDNRPDLCGASGRGPI